MRSVKYFNRITMKAAAKCRWVSAETLKCIDGKENSVLMSCRNLSKKISNILLPSILIMLNLPWKLSSSSKFSVKFLRNICACAIV